MFEIASLMQKNSRNVVVAAVGILLVMMLAGSTEKISQIHFKAAIRILSEADCVQKLGTWDGFVTVVKGAMNAAQVNKIQCGASHDEQRFVVDWAARDRSEMIDHTALGGELELADANEHLVDRCLIGQQFCFERNTATGT